ncbi:hypothetical protein QJQ45_015734, partial [Haematococcus lacustris]
VSKVPEGAVLHGCEKTRRKLREHLRLRAEIHFQLRVIASLLVLRIFLTCLPTPAQPASMECDTDSDSESDCDSEPEPQSDSESESEPEPVTQPPPRRCSARLAALAPAAPTGPPLPLDCEDPVMLRQLKDFCMFFANPNFKTCYNQLQQRLVRNRHPMLMPAFEDPSNQALLAKLQELGSINLAERFVKLYAKAARAQLGWSGEEAQLFIRMACGYGINAKSSELKAATLDKGHVADLVEEANTHRRLLGMKKQGSLQDTLPLPCRMRHAVHVCRWLEQWQQPPTPPTPGQPKRGKRRRGIAEMREFVFDPDRQIGVGIDPGVTQAVSAASGVYDPATGQLMADQLRRWKLTKGQVKHASGLNNARRNTERWLAPIKPHLQHLAAASSAGTSLEANLPGGKQPCEEELNKLTKRSKPAAEPTKGKGKAAKAKPAPQPGRWVDRDCNAALNMHRIGESRWRPLELCYWPDQGGLPAKGKEYPGLGYKRVRDKPPKAQEQQQQQPAVAQ